MQFIVKIFVALGLLAIPLFSLAQSAYLPQGDKSRPLLERLEILMQDNPDLNVFTIKPLSRKRAVDAALYADSLQKAGSLTLSATDQYNLHSLLMNSSEWVNGDKTSFQSRKPLWNTFYKTQANLLEVNEPDFFLAVNPVIQFQQSKETDNDENVFLNSRGLTLRGLIGGKVGFSAYVTDNQERGPRFVQDWINQQDAVPGAGFYKDFKKTAVDYFDARGSVNFTASKYFDLQFGYDRNFIGNGYRSLFLSDFGSSYLFFRINTRIWKLDYTNLFMELTPQTVDINAGNKLLDKKYLALHHLSVNVTRWLNLGLFEAVAFGRPNHFDFTYLNPIMFLRFSEQQNGSADNALVGFDFKANVAHRLQLYGQLLLDEFYLKELRAGNGWWANKFGVQLGGKYVNAFGVKNLDLQGELNLVRPFTYTHDDSISNYTHYNQPLAHPLGANFVEAIGLARYQPAPKWTVSARLILWKQGADTTAGSNVGTDIFESYTTRNSDYGYTLPFGPRVNGLNTQLLLSYELKQNLFIDASALIRRRDIANAPAYDQSTNMFSLGVRLNAFRREYDY